MLIDNKKNGKVGDVLKASIKNNSKLSIISGYFTIYSYHYLKNELNNVDLLNAIPEENKLKNKLQQTKIAKECAKWLESKSEVKEVKVNNSIPFNLYHIHNKGDEDLAIQGSSHLSSVGLGYISSNSFAMNTSENDFETTKDFLNTFDEIWENETLVSDIKDKVLSNLETIYEDKSPQLLYFMTL